jgi:hypothetical protein
VSSRSRGRTDVDIDAAGHSELEGKCKNLALSDDRTSHGADQIIGGFEYGA